MTTTHTNPHHFTARILPSWNGTFAALVAGVATLGAVVVVNPFTDSGTAGLGSADRIALSSSPTSEAQRSALMDAEPFELAVDAVVASALRPTIVDRPTEFMSQLDAAAASAMPSSALHDGAAFDTAIAGVVEKLAVPESLFVDGTALDVALTEAVAAVTEP